MVEATISALEAGNKRTGEDIEKLKRQFSTMLEEKKRDKALIDTLNNQVKDLEEEKVRAQD